MPLWATEVSALPFYVYDVLSPPPARRRAKCLLMNEKLLQSVSMSLQFAKFHVVSRAKRIWMQSIEVQQHLEKSVGS